MLQLYPYQREALDALYAHLETMMNNPCVSLPTGAGKSVCVATLCSDAASIGMRVLVLSHVKEILAQLDATLRNIDPGLDVGVYSASLDQRDTDCQTVVAGIHSVYKRAAELGWFDLIVVDECHLLPPDGEGMYRTFLEAARQINPEVRLVGFTATPYRTRTGDICGPDNLLNAICYEAQVRDLIEQGYLCPLRSHAAVSEMDTSNIHIRNGEFASDEVATAAEARTSAMCAETVRMTADRSSVLVFAANVAHAATVATTLADMSGAEVGLVLGHTPQDERDALIDQFKAGRLKYLVSVNVLTTGFDAPNIDCIAMMRPTTSPGLFYQLVGRGLRKHRSKLDCLVLDFGGNLRRHGPIGCNTYGRGAATRTCPRCRAVVTRAASACGCGYRWPRVSPREVHTRGHVASSDAGDLAGDLACLHERHDVGPVVADVAWYPVSEVRYYVHTKAFAAQHEPKTMRVEYAVEVDGGQWTVKQWVCPEHNGFARGKFVKWWRERSFSLPPATAHEAVDAGRSGSLRVPTEIQVSTTGRFPEILDCRWPCLPADMMALSEPMLRTNNSDIF